MKLKLLLSFIFITTAHEALTQDRPGNIEIAIGYGMLTSEQLLDGNHLPFLSSVPAWNEYTNNNTTGLFFVNGKYFVSGHVSLGLTGGVEQESGRWNVPGIGHYTGASAIGTFSRTAITVAPEMSAAYINHKYFRFYTTAGIGATFKNETDIYDNGSYNSAGQNVSGDKVKFNQLLFAGYYSPLGISFSADGEIFFHAEFGFGYKGVVNLGITYRFSTRPRRLGDIIKPSPNPLILLPATYPDNSGVTYLETLHVGRAAHPGIPAFYGQLAQIDTIARREGGNVFKITTLKEDYNGVSRLSGKLFYAKNYEQFKNEAFSYKVNPFKDQRCAYIIIYNTGRGNSTIVADSGRFVLHGHSKHVIKVFNEGTYHFFSRNNSVDIDVKFGHNYYVRVFRTNRWANMNAVDELQGELESSVSMPETSRAERDNE